MEISVLLESLPANGYRATSLAPTHLSVEAASREEAISKVSHLVQAQFAHAELVQISVPLPSDSHPWRPLEGAWANHPDAADFEQNLREYRRQVDADSDRL